MEKSKVRYFKLAMGQMLLAKKKATMERPPIKIIKGLKILPKLNPALFMAVSSLCSDNAPMVMMLDIKMAKGRAMLTIRAETKSKS